MATAGAEALDRRIITSCLLPLLPVSIQFNGADRDRTGDPLVANQVLSQLSYRPVTTTAIKWLLVIGYWLFVLVPVLIPVLVSLAVLTTNNHYQ